MAPPRILFTCYSVRKGYGDKSHKKTYKMTGMKATIFILIIGFTLNLAWENTHVFLYKDFPRTLNGIPIIIYASIVDAFTILFIFFILSLFKKLDWIKDFNYKDAIIVAIIGGLIAIVYELQALYFEKWAYKEIMPIIPFLKIGLTPFLQMIILPITTFWIVKVLTKKSP